MTEDPRIDPADLRNVRFPGSSRRYDARSVDQFLETVAGRIAATNVLVDELRARVAELEAAPPTPAPTPPPQLAHLDDDELVRLVGEETTSVLSTARRAADDIRSKAEESAARMIREATAESDRLTEEARTRAAELTRDAEQALELATAEATTEAARIRDAAVAEAEEATTQATEMARAELAAAEQHRSASDAEVERIIEEAREEGRGMVQEAKEVRTRVLEDLQRRRDTARDQIERLLAGRERLLAAYELVRENLDDITGQLADALPDPGEPELPDGFVGVIGASAPVAVEEGRDERGPGDEVVDVASSPAEVDDTVAPAVAAEEEAGEPTGDDVAAGVEDGLGPVAADELVAADVMTDDAAEDAHGTAEGAGPPESTEDGGERSVDGDLEDGLDDEFDVELDDGATELDADEAEAHAAGGSGDVDALFARLRAEREQSVARAREVVAPADDAQAEEPAEVPVDAGALATTDEQDPAPEADARAGQGRGDVDRIPAEFLAAGEDLTARREALTPLEDALNRALKRRLADEQNELLDLLRRSGTTTATELLPELDVQVGGYSRLAEKHLRAAAAAGGGGADVDVAPLADALGAALVEPFRRRVERSSAEVDGDPDELDERLRALYREWKVQHITPVAQDALLSAYALGTLQAAEPDGQVRWLIDPAQGPCPDAQDNALAGTVTSGEAFPTGDRCPQAHPGCSCLLVRT